MMNFKDHYYNRNKILPILALLISTILFTGCFSKNSIEFCEDITDKLETNNCGNKFYSGDLATLINSKNKFESDSIFIKVFLLDTGEESEVSSQKVKVDKNKKSVKVNIPMYQTGEFIVKVYKNKEIISMEKVKIID